MTASRRLGAILAADVAGYSRLTVEDEEGMASRKNKGARVDFRPLKSAALTSVLTPFSR